jgi:phosphoribosylamine--glycine ligase/phosphoribosylformylglycinamidine cyclo-ligase
MRVLVVGSGAREHALVWRLSDSPSVEAIFCAPGNAGTEALAHNEDIKADDIEGLVEFAESKHIDLVVVGPEVPLSKGLADRLEKISGRTKVCCFGPKAGAARIESSKRYAKMLMEKYGIPTARYADFDDVEAASAFVRSAPWPVVIKASGLAAGKGVFLPESLAEAEEILRNLFVNKTLGDAGTQVVIEERLTGEEVSILGFCDGSTVRVMPPTQDHKRLFEGDEGPNTGGMGSIAWASKENMARAEALSAIVLSPMVKALANEGTPFVGVLYAGVILSETGPKVLEYNCRFGDPEAQSILPLLETDLAQVLSACVQGTLAETDIRWKNMACATVVLADEGYAIDPFNPQPRLFKDYGTSEDSEIFHAATTRREGQILALGGRLACATSWAPTLDGAIEKAFARTAMIDMPGSRYRRDIGKARRFLRSEARVLSPIAASYAASGVDIEAGDRAVALMSAAVRSTYGPEVLAGIGSFGGVYSAKALKEMRDPVLVASTDGVGTKVKLAALADRYEGIGQDIVNHCIDDILVQGAEPLFFLDYVATSKLNPSMVASIVEGMACACRESGCALIGGETAEMPGVYLPKEFDIAGAIVGVAERDLLLPRADLEEGDILVGLGSSGLHTNGYSLARSVFSEAELFAFNPDLGAAPIDLLLKPHRSYLPVLKTALREKPGLVKGLAHITGGGFEGNVPRILPSGLDALIDVGAWDIPALFALIQKKGSIPLEEMYRVFNMGIGMLVAINPERYAEFAACAIGEFPVVGRLAKGSGQARLSGRGL